MGQLDVYPELVISRKASPKAALVPMVFVMVVCLAVAGLVGTRPTPKATPTPAVTASAGSQTVQLPVVNLIVGRTRPPSSPYRRGVSGTSCGWWFVVSCSVVVYPGTVFDMHQVLEERWRNTAPAAMAGLFALVCLPVSGPAAIVCGILGAIYGSYIKDQINQAAGHWLAGKPAKGECLKISWYWIGPYPVGAMNFQPYSGGRCKWFPNKGTGGGGGSW